MNSADKEPVVGLPVSERIQSSDKSVDPSVLLEQEMKRDLLEVLGIELDPSVLDEEDYPALNVA
jgi:hypothetical protein